LSSGKSSSFRALSLFAVVGALACNPPAAPAPLPGDMPSGGTVVATVDGHDVTQEMVDLTIKQLPPQLKEQLEQSGQIGQVQEQVVVGEVLYREAIKRKLHEDTEVKTTVALAARSALTDALFNKVIEERATAARVQQYYDDHLVQYKQDQVQARILVVATEKAEEVKGKLDGGGDFVALVAEYSEDPNTKGKGGDLGWIEKRSMPPNFSEPLFAAAKGDVVGPIEAGPRQLFFKIEDTRDATPLAEVEDQIKEALKQDIITEYIEEMKNGAAIENKGGSAAAPADPAAAGAPAAPAAPAAPKGHSADDGHGH